MVFDSGFFEWVLVGIIILGAGFASSQSTKRKKRRGTKNRGRGTNTKTAPRNRSSQVRSDEEILSSSFSELNGFEFERLLALYFRDKGYIVQEVGVGGKDGGVDLVITDKRGEKTAVQAKCYKDGNLVQPSTVRELVGAKRNHGCILSLLVTSSDLTMQAKREADQFKVDYWHGALLEHKLRAWGKWQPSKKRRVKSPF